VPSPEAGLGPGHVHTRDARPATDHRPVDATLYFTEWNDAARHLTFRCTSALTCSSRLAIGVAVAILAVGPPVRLSGQSAAPTIDTIIVVNRNVFDLQEADAPSFIARLANRLHARTRAGSSAAPADRSQGPLRLGASAESERACATCRLQSRAIDTTRLDGRLALRIATTDGWTRSPSSATRPRAGNVTWMVGLVEDNLLAPRRPSPPCTTRPRRRIFGLGHVNPHFLSRRVGCRLSTATSRMQPGTGWWGRRSMSAARRALITDGGRPPSAATVPAVCRTRWFPKGQ